MTSSTKRKHVCREQLQSTLAAPVKGQQVVRVLAGRGNNLHEAEAADGTAFLISMPSKFRKNIWIKRGDFVLVEDIPEGDKVKAEIVQVLTKDHIKFYKNQKCWPERFEEEEDMDIFCKANPNQPKYEESYSSSSSGED